MRLVKYLNKYRTLKDIKEYVEVAKLYIKKVDRKYERYIIEKINDLENYSNNAYKMPPVVLHEEFDRIYKSFKKNTKEKKEWALITQIQTKENKAIHSLKMKNARKSDRQQQLKNLLVNTVNLTNLLKQQIKIFKKKGIYGC